MTIEKPQGAFDLEGELDQAKKILSETKKLYLKMRAALSNHPEPLKGVKELTQFGGEYLKALNIIGKQEADLEKQCTSIRGVLRGGALDLEAARNEILGRVARIRERG